MLVFKNHPLNCVARDSIRTVTPKTPPLCASFPPRDMQVLHTPNFTQAKVYLLPARFFFLFSAAETRTSLISIRLQLATDAILCGALTLIVRDEQS